MKQVKNTILIIIVIGIWGAIGYSLHKRLKPQKGKPAMDNVEELQSFYTDTFSLELSYDDPFLKRNNNNQNVSTKPPNRNSASNQKRVKSVKPKKWPNIQYHGYAKKEGQMVYLVVSVNGEGRIIKSNESFDDVLIQSYSEDKIVCLFNGKEKVFEVK